MKSKGEKSKGRHRRGCAKAPHRRRERVSQECIGHIGSRQRITFTKKIVGKIMLPGVNKPSHSSCVHGVEQVEEMEV